MLVAVEDHGIAIEPERLAHIFDRSNHLEESGETLFSGIGLVLAIARQVIEQHHRRPEVTRTVGAGSTLSVQLSAIRVSL